MRGLIDLRKRKFRYCVVCGKPMRSSYPHCMDRKCIDEYDKNIEKYVPKKTKD